MRKKRQKRPNKELPNRRILKVKAILLYVLNVGRIVIVLRGGGVGSKCVCMYVCVYAEKTLKISEGYMEQ